MGYQVMQSVKIDNEKLEAHGKAGHVVEAVLDTDTKSKVSVRLDDDGEVYEFDQTEVKGL
ncbi:hypothetical protein [Duganella radicis]|uniref:Uncharacterized protein n=1 Tax=Duganella radicis TaxID=551988 RepID=A0A6L6PB84_9BURK|nr:hypothetical protein [Duganella radicis]MTV36272.1 hypothetical protein [Duganella radicis]